MSKKPPERDATPLPISKARTAFYEWLSKKPLNEQMAVLNDLKTSPDAAASRRLAELLNAAQMDPAVRQSATLSSYVFIVGEVLADYMPGMTLRQMLEPLQTILSRNGGGRPTNEEVWTCWDQMVQKKRARHQIATMREIYGDVADEWEAMGHKRVDWKTVRNGISKLKQRVPNKK